MDRGRTLQFMRRGVLKDGYPVDGSLNGFEIVFARLCEDEDVAKNKANRLLGVKGANHRGAGQEKMVR
jgi:hypothetical protein